MSNLDIYCVTDKDIPFLEKSNYKLAAVGKKKFSDKYRLKYPLGSDEGKNCNKLGIWIEKSMYGRKYFGIDRSTFVMDKNGKILNSWNKVKVKGHVEEVYNFCKDQ